MNRRHKEDVLLDILVDYVFLFILDFQEHFPIKIMQMPLPGAGFSLFREIPLPAPASPAPGRVFITFTKTCSWKSKITNVVKYYV